MKNNETVKDTCVNVGTEGHCNWGNENPAVVYVVGKSLRSAVLSHALITGGFEVKTYPTAEPDVHWLDDLSWQAGIDFEPEECKGVFGVKHTTKKIGKHSYPWWQQNLNNRDKY